MRDEVTPKEGGTNHPKSKLWETFAHESDVGIRGYGKNLEDAFANCAIAMTSVITDPEKVQPQVSVEIHCTEADPELMLLDFINALVYEMDVRRMIFSRFQIKKSGPELQVVAWGEPVDFIRHDPAVEVKGATLTELRVFSDDGLYCAQCVVDV